MEQTIKIPLIRIYQDGVLSILVPFSDITILSIFYDLVLMDHSQCNR